jgi:hypothetical protein
MEAVLKAFKEDKLLGNKRLFSKKAEAREEDQIRTFTKKGVKTVVCRQPFFYFGELKGN